MSATSTAGFYLVLGIILFFIGLKIYDILRAKAPGLFKKKESRGEREAREENEETLQRPSKPINKGDEYL